MIRLPSKGVGVCASMEGLVGVIVPSDTGESEDTGAVSVVSVIVD